MLAAKTLLATMSTFRAARGVVAALALVLLSAAAAPAEAGIIVAQDDGAGILADVRGLPSPIARSDSTDEQQRDLSGEGALPGGAGTSSSGTSGSGTSSAGGASAILPQACGLCLSACSAGVCEERALRLPPSPFFDHLRPPQG